MSLKFNPFTGTFDWVSSVAAAVVGTFVFMDDGAYEFMDGTVVDFMDA